MLRQGQGLLLGQGHQPFGVSQLWVLGLGVALVWQDILLQACQPVSEALPLAMPFRCWFCGSTIRFFADLIQKILGCHKPPEVQRPRIVPRGRTDGPASALCCSIAFR